MAASVNELLADAAIHHAVDLAQYSTGVVRRIIALLNRTDADLFAQLTAALGQMDAESFTVERLEAILQSVRSLNAQAYQRVEMALTAELRSFVEIEWPYQQNLFPSVGITMQLGTTVSAAQVYSAAMSRPFQGRLLSEWSKSIEADRMVRIRDAIRIGFVEGQTSDEIVKRIRGTRAKGYADGIIEIDRRNAEAVVRTAVQHTAAGARDEMFKQGADVIKAIQWSSALDGRTTEQCFPASTLVLPAGDLRGVSRRPWDGDLVVVATASGKKLRATPNHPVLTARGWRAIQELQPGADVLYRIGADVGGVAPAEDVEMPASIGAIFDALGKPSFGDVLVKRTAQVDFHGDGMAGDHEVNYPRSKGDLRLALESAFGNEVAEKLLILVAVPGSLPTEREDQSTLMRLGLVDVAAQGNVGSVEDFVEAGFAHSLHAADVDRFDAILEEADELSFIRSACRVAAAKRRHAPSAFQDARHSGCFDAVSASNCGSGLAVGIAADDVVSVEREFFSGHVYNLQTSTGFYIADGFVVHNCRIRDGKQYTPDDHKPIGHKIPWGSGPGRLHWRCRSAAVAITKSLSEITGIPGLPENPVGMRASMDGAVPGDTTYGEWIKKQSAARQDEIVGPTRGALMRSGKLPFDSLYTDRGEYLTLDQLRERNAAAFKRAGV